MRQIQWSALSTQLNLRRTPFGPARWTHVSVFSSGWIWVEWAVQFSHCLLSRMALELLEGGGLVWPKCRESLLDVNGPRGCFISYNDRENNKITPTGKWRSLCRSSTRISISVGAVSVSIEHLGCISYSGWTNLFVLLTEGRQEPSWCSVL